MPRTKVIPCHFTTVGLQIEHRKINLRIDKARLSIQTAEELFCDRRLKGTVEVILQGEGTEQPPLLKKDGLASVKAEFDVKQYTSKAETFTCGLIFAKDDITPDTLAKFQNRDGKLTVTSNKMIPDGENRTDEDED